MPSPANMAAGQATAAGAAIRPIRPRNNAPIAANSAGRRSGMRPLHSDTSRPAAISAAVTAPSNWPAETADQPNAV
ncbi:hypothetical protein D3C72_2471860 [compost metagenome]